MRRYSEAAWERAMKVQEVILRAMAKRITWWQAAEVMGISDRSLRRLRQRYEQYGYDGLFDRRRGRPSPCSQPKLAVWIYRFQWPAVTTQYAPSSIGNIEPLISIKEWVIRISETCLPSSACAVATAC